MRLCPSPPPFRSIPCLRAVLIGVKTLVCKLLFLFRRVGCSTGWLWMRPQSEKETTHFSAPGTIKCTDIFLIYLNFCLPWGSHSTGLHNHTITDHPPLSSPRLTSANGQHIRPNDHSITRCSTVKSLDWNVYLNTQFQSATRINWCMKTFIYSKNIIIYICMLQKYYCKYISLRILLCALSQYIKSICGALLELHLNEIFDALRLCRGTGRAKN